MALEEGSFKTKQLLEWLFGLLPIRRGHRVCAAKLEGADNLVVRFTEMVGLPARTPANLYFTCDSIPREP